MSKVASRRARRPLTRRDYYSLLFLTVAVAVAGPALIGYAYYADQRDRPSLQWPKVTGTVMHCVELHHWSRRNTYYSVDITYTYLVNGQRFTSRQIALWSDDWHGQDTGDFVAAHPVNKAVDVYYDPQKPGNAVLVPGPDVAGNRNSIRYGGIATAGGVLMALLMTRKLGQVKAEIKSTRSQAAARPASLPHGFASYEPGFKRKLNVFPDREALDEFLGRDDGKPVQEWQPEDRIIDATGREYRLVKPPGKKNYDIEPTGQTWSCQQLLDVAEADGKLLKKDPVALDRRLDAVPDAERMAVLLKAIDEMPAGPRWVIGGLLLFLLLFFLAVMFGFGALFTWLQKFWH